VNEADVRSEFKLESVGDYVLVDSEFQTFVDGLKFRYISANELFFMGGSNGSGKCAGKNFAPPKELWPNIVNTARMLDEIRHRLSYQINIISAYRAPSYNSCIGGEKASRHMRFNAIDFIGAQGNAETWWSVAKSVRLSNPDFKGGIGYYKKKNFVHIDTRGTNANWKGKGGLNLPSAICELRPILGDGWFGFGCDLDSVKVSVVRVFETEGRVI
jgi:hypothetical protein